MDLRPRGKRNPTPSMVIDSFDANSNKKNCDNSFESQLSDNSLSLSTSSE